MTRQILNSMYQTKNFMSWCIYLYVYILTKRLQVHKNVLWLFHKYFDVIPLCFSNLVQVVVNRITTTWTRFTNISTLKQTLLLQQSHGWIRKKSPFIRWIDSPFLILDMLVQLHSSATLAWQNGSPECHFGTKLWARPHDVFGIAGSTWFRSLLSKDFRSITKPRTLLKRKFVWQLVFSCSNASWK